jgi:SpoVK/Ycf46/Vps4 family AAA+-type ATPase
LVFSKRISPIEISTFTTDGFLGGLPRQIGRQSVCRASKSNLYGVYRKTRAIVASSDQLKALIKSHISRDDGHFYSVAMQVAAHEAKLGHGKLAEELRGLIDAAKTRLGQDGSGKLVPIAGALQSGGKSRGELASLLTVTYPANRLSDMVLDDQASQQLARIIKEQRLLAQIREHGLSPRRKLLLVGPPGTGKTMTASALAGELGIPLFLVRLDSLITKFMGETASKLRQVFDAIADIRGVYFFDEFDAIGSQRGAANDVGEIRRVLNSFLQMIEHDQSTSLIVAATNHPEVLDYALFRRFDDVLEYHLPTPEQALDLVRSRLGSFAPKPFKKDGLVEQAQGLSYAEICRAVDESIKDAIMHDQTKVQRAELGRALGERRLISTKLAQNNKHLSNHAGSNQR